jgi:uncharacterized membrane protein YdjX (TVP38/TMEM64 family)
MNNAWRLADFCAVILLFIMGFVLIFGSPNSGTLEHMQIVATACIIFLVARGMFLRIAEEDQKAERTREQTNQSNANVSQKSGQEEDGTSGSVIDSD